MPVLERWDEGIWFLSPRTHSPQWDCSLGNLTFRSETQAPPTKQQFNWWMVASQCASVHNQVLTNPRGPAVLPPPRLGSLVSQDTQSSLSGEPAKPWINTFPGFSVCHQFKEIPSMASSSLQNRYSRHQEDLLCLTDSLKSCAQQWASLGHLNSDSFYTWNSVPMEQEETYDVKEGNLWYFCTSHLRQSHKPWQPASDPGSSPGSSLYRANAGRVGVRHRQPAGSVGTMNRPVPRAPYDHSCVSGQLVAAP